jgi:hypothetical protein
MSNPVTTDRLTMKDVLNHKWVNQKSESFTLNTSIQCRRTHIHTLMEKNELK